MSACQLRPAVWKVNGVDHTPCPLRPYALLVSRKGSHHPSARPLGWLSPTGDPHLSRSLSLLAPVNLQVSIGVNYVGHFVLTHLLMEQLKAAAPSRVIWVSSPAEATGVPDLSDPL